VYGRLDGDVTLVTGVTGGIVARQSRRFIGGDFRLRYLDAAGIAISYEEADAFARTTEPGRVRRTFLAGIELRPLFPIRFLKNMQSGKHFLDLVLDSIGIDLATTLPVLQGSAVRRPGLALGLAFEVPIGTNASGLWARFSSGVRWSAPRLEGDDDPGGRAVVFGIGLAWHQVLSTHVVDAGDRKGD